MEDIQKRYDFIESKIINLRNNRGSLKLKNVELNNKIIEIKTIENEKNKKILNSLVSSASIYTIYILTTSTMFHNYNIKLPLYISIPLYMMPLLPTLTYPIKRKITLDKTYESIILNAHDNNLKYQKEISKNNALILTINVVLEDLILKEQKLIEQLYGIKPKIKEDIRKDINNIYSRKLIKK